MEDLVFAGVGVGAVLRHHILQDCVSVDAAGAERPARNFTNFRTMAASRLAIYVNRLFANSHSVWRRTQPGRHGICRSADTLEADSDLDPEDQ